MPTSEDDEIRAIRAGRESKSDSQDNQEDIMRSVFSRWRCLFVLAALATAALTAMACGGETVVQTVIVEKPVTQVETVVEKVVETVVVEKQVTQVERVVETVVVERQVEGKTVTVVETVVVEKPVTRTEQVVQTVVVEKERVVVATPTPSAAAREPSGILTIAVDDVGTPLYTNFTMSWPHNDYASSSGILEGLTRIALDNWTQENELADSMGDQPARRNVLPGCNAEKGYPVPRGLRGVDV